MKICIPSRNRSKKITTTKLFKSAIVFVPENEYDEYSENIDNTIVKVPLEHNGITKTRNYILDTVNDDVLFIDDDLKEIGYFKNSIRINLFDEKYENEMIEEFYKCFQITKEMGLSLFGVESGGSLFANHVFKPISYKGAINGTCLGVIKSNERFNESYEVKEDYEFILRHYIKDGGFMKFNYFYLRTKHWANAGGCVDYRTNKMEQEAIEKLDKKYQGLFKVGKGKNMFHTTLTI